MRLDESSTRTTKRWPTVFVSHGSPMLVFEDIAAREFLVSLGQRLGKPESILAVSAHWETELPTVSAARQPETIHDFQGFPEELYRLRYPAPGAPELAARTADLLTAAGIQNAVDPNRGLDHGAWNPLLLMYPDADVPVTQLSVQPSRSPAHHVAVGRALLPLRRESVLILASGGAVHNLRQFRVDRETPAAWATSFDDWLADRVAAGDEAALVDYRGRDDSRSAHPTDEHFLPFFVALGAGTDRDGAGKELHRSFAHGSLSMAAYGWGPLPQAA